MMEQQPLLQCTHKDCALPSSNLEICGACLRCTFCIRKWSRRVHTTILGAPLLGSRWRLCTTCDASNAPSFFHIKTVEGAQHPKWCYAPHQVQASARIICTTCVAQLCTMLLLYIDHFGCIAPRLVKQNMVHILQPPPLPNASFLIIININ